MTGQSFLFFFLISLTSSFSGASANTVDGFRDYKFGSSLSKLKEMRPCALTPEENPPKGLDFYHCHDFKIFNKKSVITFEFRKDRLIRVAFIIHAQTIDFFDDVFKSMTEKYGKPSFIEYRSAQYPHYLVGNTQEALKSMFRSGTGQSSVTAQWVNNQVEVWSSNTFAQTVHAPFSVAISYQIKDYSKIRSEAEASYIKDEL
jgi:hypothetical protein